MLPTDLPPTKFETHEIKDYTVTVESRGEHKTDPVRFIDYSTRHAGRMFGDKVMQEGLYTLEVEEGLPFKHLGEYESVHYKFSFRVIKPTNKHC